MNKLPVDELLRLACIYAERDQEEFLRCLNNSDLEEETRTRAFLKQLREYRLKRWGKTKLEAAMEKMTPVPIQGILVRHEE